MYCIIMSKQPETIDVAESSTNSTGYPGRWRYPRNPEICCIYRVPNNIRMVNPEAYTPQLLLIGPLHHSLKSQAFKSRGDITNTKLMGYSNMEEHKKIYLEEFTRRVGEETIAEFRRMIEEVEYRIRESYSESTDWIPSPEFVEMILHDSVFILEYILRIGEGPERRGDPLMDEPCLEEEVKKDLMLLENQLPYFILEKLFEPIFPSLYPGTKFQGLMINYFGFEGKLGNNPKFSHFTDMLRCVHVETLQELSPRRDSKLITHMYNADKLYSGGVKFEAVENEFHLHVIFKNGCLKMPCLIVDDGKEMILRNIMAFEQCHFPYNAHVCNYIIFLDYLIYTEKDVELLVEKGIINNLIGKHSSVAEMVNKLCLGIYDFGSEYYDTAIEVNRYYSNSFNRSYTILKSVYFGNLWIGTGTIAAMVLLIFTLIQTVASIIQVKQKPS